MNPLAFLSKRPLRPFSALVAAGTLLFALGCGSGGNNGGGGGGGGNDSGFTKASLKGQYAFTLRGIATPDNVNSFFFVEGGVLTADGNGNITSGTDDFIANSTAFSDQVTGVYDINSDGSGNVQFNFAQGGSSIYHIAFSDTSHFYMEQADLIGTSGGSGEKQDTSAFTSVPSGTFVYQAHDLVGTSKVGVMTWSGGNLSGSGDVLTGGTLISNVTISGTAQTPGTSTGRGTVTVIDDTGTNDYVYYVVNSRKLRLLNTDALSSLSIGQAEQQTGGPFSVASMNGSYVFGSSGETGVVAGIHSVGRFTADGAGNVTAGTFDTVQDGTPVTDISLNPGSVYTVNSIGRALVSLNLSTGLANEKVMYLVSPTRAYFLVDDPLNVEDGTADKQSGSAFSVSSMKGQYALFMDGFDSNSSFPWRDRVGTWTPDGAGSVRTNYRASGFSTAPPPLGSVTDANLTGTYAVDSTGRSIANVNSLSSNLIFYMVSGNSGYILQADNGVDIGGAFTIQTAP